MRVADRVADEGDRLASVGLLDGRSVRHRGRGDRRLAGALLRPGGGDPENRQGSQTHHPCHEDQ